MSHCVVDYPYPTADKGTQAIVNIVTNWSEVISDKPCLAHCVYVIEGVALSFGFPLVDGFGDAPIESEADAKAVIEEAAAVPQTLGAPEGDSIVGKIDWMKVLKALKFLLNFIATE